MGLGLGWLPFPGVLAKANGRQQSEFRITPERLIKNAQQNVQGLVDQVILDMGIRQDENPFKINHD